ncbi:MAG: AraC family transcriptional regulator [Myxococcales bacterium]|nr:AraC family transcriptional regulator [Myxococcales bacterium]
MRSFVVRTFADQPETALGQVREEPGLYRGMKDCHAVVVPRKGWVTFRYRGRDYLGGPGVLRLHSPGEMVTELTHSGPTSFDVVILWLPEEVGGPSCPVLSVSDPRSESLLGLHAALAHGACLESRRWAFAQAAATLAELGASSRATSGHERATVRRARRYLLDRLSERVRLDEVAEHVGMDRFALIRAFREAFGVPPYTFLTHARLVRARRLLHAGERPSDVAPAVGLYDQSQLNRHFRRLLGVTPGEYARGRRVPADEWSR